MKNKIYKEYGLGKLTLIFFGFIICLSLYVGSKVLPFYFYYYELESHMQTLVKVAGSNSDKELRQKLNYHIKKMGIPVREDDLIIVRTPGKISFSLEYEEVFYFDWKDKTYELYVFPFTAEAEGAY